MKMEGLPMMPQNSDNQPEQEVSQKLAEERVAMEAVDSTRLPMSERSANMNEHNKYKALMALKSQEFNIMTATSDEEREKAEEVHKEIIKQQYEPWHGTYERQINTPEEAMAYIEEIDEMNRNRTLGIPKKPELEDKSKLEDLEEAA
jgi:methyl coenzyme M reductase subunit D